MSNDHPRYGCALCSKHRWAIEEHLIVPGTENFWRISSRLDDRWVGEQELLVLSDRPLAVPAWRAYHPFHEASDWRIARLQ